MELSYREVVPSELHEVSRDPFLLVMLGAESESQTSSLPFLSCHLSCKRNIATEKLKKI